MELGRPATPRELRGDLVDPFGHDQHRTIRGFRQEVAHRAVEASRQHDALPILSHQGKGAVEAEH